MSTLHVGAALLVGAIAATATTVIANGSSSDARRDLQQLATLRVFFGHQSVGANLLDGIARVAREAGVTLNVTETVNPAEVRPGTIAHAFVGENGDPLRKLAHFEQIMNSGMGETVDVAMVKFCYVDFTPSTDVAALFGAYQQVMRNLATRYPRVKFVHLTVPLTAVQRGPRAWVKRILGRPLTGLDDNARREEFNALLRKTYSGSASVFDVAMAESTRRDGDAEIVKVGGAPVRVLVPEYTDDGGHLTIAARQLVGRKMLSTLARVP